MGWTRPAAARRSTVADLFRAPRGMTTGLIWLAFFMNLMMIFFLVSWMPAVLRGAGALWTGRS